MDIIDDDVISIDSDEELIKLKKNTAVRSKSCCRICLLSHCKLFPLNSYGLSEVYEQLTGVTLNQDDGIPQELCVQCVTQLNNYRKFRAKSVEGDWILKDIVKQDGKMTFWKIQFNYNNVIKKKYTNLSYCMSILHLDIKPLVQNKPEPVDIKNESQTEIESDAAMEFDDALSEAVENDDEKPKNEPQIKEDETVNITKPMISKNKKPKITTRTRKKVSKQTMEDAAAKQDALIKEYFSIKELSFEEQVKVVEARKDKISRLPYKCELCYKGFISQMAFKTHLVLHSPAKGKSECKVCHIRCKYDRETRSHVRNVHRYQYSCNQCHYVVSAKSSALMHADWHKGKRYSCEVCGLVFEKKTSLFSHVRILHPSNVVCNYCGYSFINERGLNLHIKSMHYNDTQVPLSGPWCTDCNVQFSSEEVLQVHNDIKHQNADKPLRNTIVNQHRVRMRAVERDKRSGSRPYRNCKQDRERYNSRYHPCHMAAPTPCEVCGLVVNSWSEYRCHFVSNHPDTERKLYSTRTARTNYPELMCDKCGKIFKCHVALREHIENHGEVKAYKCEQCEKSFKTESKLRMHRRLHLGPRYTCPICGKGFNQSGNRDRHYTYTHSEEKRFKCDYCEKRFKTKCEKKLHVKHIHLKEPWPKRNRNRTK